MKRSLIHVCLGLACAGALALAMSGCDTMQTAPTTAPAANLSSTPAAAPAKPAMPAPSTPVAAATLPTIRVKAGADADFKDSKGVTWSADKGFDGGSTQDRQDTLQITSNDRPELFKTERYFDGGTGSYSFAVPNGKYNVNLYFSEDYEGNTSEDSRIFTFAIKDGDPTTGKVVKEVKDFSPWKKGGGFAKGYIEKTPVTVTNGKISITFTQQVENPQINAIEIVPQ